MQLLKTLARKWATFRRMDVAQLRLLAEAMAWLAIARLILLVFPFRWVSRWLGSVSAPAGVTPPQVESDAAARTARAVGWAVERMAANAPFKAVCLQQAVAAKFLLARRGIPSLLHLGVAREAARKPDFIAHAWLDVAGIKVTGYPIDPGLTEIACIL